jgi:hypothetical protein
MSGLQVLHFTKQFIFSKAAAIILLIAVFGFGVVEAALRFGWVAPGVLTRANYAIGLLVGCLGFFYKEWKENSKGTVDIDRTNFQKFLKKLPPRGAMAIFEEHYFEKPFSNHLVSQIENVLDYYRQPGKRFLDHELEAEMTSLLGSLETSLGKIVNYTVMIDENVGGFTNEFRLGNRELYEARARELNELTRATAANYRRLVDAWSKKLLLPHD